MNADAWFIRFSPDGSRLAFGSAVVTICRADGSDPQVIGPGTSPKWLSAHELVYTRQPDGALMHWPSGKVLDAAGFNDVDALEGQWAGWHAGRDEIVTSWGLRLPGCRMPRLTMFGVVYAQPAPGDQWRVVDEAGNVLVEGPVMNLRTAPDGLVTWMQHVGGRWEVWGSARGKVQRLHVAAGHEYWPVPLSDAGGYPWVLTHTETALWLRPWGSSTGHIVHVGTTDFPDACWTPQGWRVAWSERGHLRTAHIPHDRPMTVFRETPAVPTPEPPKEPERPVDMSMLDTLNALRAAYGPTLTDDQCVELLNAAAWQHRAEGYGLSKKTSGTRGRRHDGQECCHDVLMLRDGTYWDCLSGAGAASTPVWGQPSGTITDPARGWVAPIAPTQGEVPSPVPVPPPVVPTPTPPTVTCRALSGDEVRAAVRQEMALVLERVAHTDGVVTGLIDAVRSVQEQLATAAIRREELADLTAQRIQATTTARPVTVSGRVSITGTTTLRGTVGEPTR
ncbi:MAG TPA: hypothetical protein PKC83_11105 [Gemmatimonadaceae bacterium]|nr:hypothetical protein [Gemmatimonadaceae bacterium]